MEGHGAFCTSAHRALLAARVVRGNARRSSPGPAKGCLPGDLMASPDFFDDRRLLWLVHLVGRPGDRARFPGGDMGNHGHDSRQNLPTPTRSTGIVPNARGSTLHLWNDSETASLRTVPQARAGLCVQHACHTHAACRQVSIQDACCTPSAQMQGVFRLPSSSVQKVCRRYSASIQHVSCSACSRLPDEVQRFCSRVATTPQQASRIVVAGNPTALSRGCSTASAQVLMGCDTPSATDLPASCKVVTCPPHACGRRGACLRKAGGAASP
jgi:hypothetical protein